MLASAQFRLPAIMLAFWRVRVSHRFSSPSLSLRDSGCDIWRHWKNILRQYSFTAATGADWPLYPFHFSILPLSIHSNTHTHTHRPTAAAFEGVTPVSESETSALGATVRDEQTNSACHTLSLSNSISLSPTFRIKAGARASVSVQSKSHTFPVGVDRSNTHFTGDKMWALQVLIPSLFFHHFTLWSWHRHFSPVPPNRGSHPFRHCGGC